MKKVIHMYFYGIGIGGIIYSLSLMVAGIKTQTASKMVSCLVFSGLMGLASLYYDIENWSFLQKSACHFLTTVLIVFAMNTYNHWLSPQEYLGFFLEFSFIYLIIWLCIYVLNYRSSQAINQKLRERQR
ncbi:UNVERIFIED_CONTAM: DUF3021 domain-containing protein [Streptococcus canis]|uniref:DUF3021 domain-containing protein n=1 Tax=Streptococcus canis TaxID=1329 RepID=UPI000B8AE4B9|nr:DUF3021 domain-containing protein [Streptococcus canis]QJD13077.1 DUF3021 domain-containing protein [Streptococcus canis]GFG48554.1 hypothetical protein ScFU97_18930 [Streptococcus canis]VTR80750.1 membrane protein [Streptococcus canis]